MKHAKRILSLLLALTMMLMLAACGGSGSGSGAGSDPIVGKWVTKEVGTTMDGSEVKVEAPEDSFTVECKADNKVVLVVVQAGTENKAEGKWSKDGDTYSFEIEDEALTATLKDKELVVDMMGVGNIYMIQK